METLYFAYYPNKNITYANKGIIDFGKPGFI